MAYGSVNVGGGAGEFPNIGDWSAYDVFYDWSGNLVEIPSESWGEFVNHSGEGYLVFCRGFSNNLEWGNGDIRITVDGSSYIYEGVSPDGGGNQGNLILEPIYFGENIKIELYNGSPLNITFGCDYTLLKMNDNPSKDQTVLSQSNRKMAYHQNESGNLADALNINGSGYLLSVKFDGFHQSISRNVRGTIEIDGTLQMDNRLQLKHTGTNNAQSLFLGPIRFDSSLRIAHACGTGSVAFCRIWYTLD